MGPRFKPLLVIPLLLCCAAGWALAAPTGVTLSINQGDSRTTSDVVWLYMAASTTSPPMEMRFSNWGFGVSSQWEPYFQKKLWMLEPAGTLNATKGVTIEVKDASGESATAGGSIFVASSLNLKAVAEKRWYYTNTTGSGLSGLSHPSGICFDGVNLWVTCQYADVVQKVRAADAAPVAAYPTGDGPYHVIYDGIHVWVVNYGDGTVTELQGDGTYVRTVAIGPNPRYGLFDGTYVWVSGSTDGKLYRIKAADGTVASDATIGATGQPAFDGNSLWVAAAGNVVKKVRPSDFAVLATYPVGQGPISLLFDGANIWVANYTDNTVTKLRAIDGANKGTFSVGNSPYDLAFDGATIWVSCYWGYEVRKLRAADGTPWGSISFYESQPYRLAFDGSNVWVSLPQTDQVIRL
jgi:hypothetical protein